MTATATAADYTWFDEHFPWLAEAYCIMLVRGIAPRELLRRIGATEQPPVTGVEGLEGPAYGAWDEHEGDLLLVGATAVGDWTLTVEPNGHLGVTDQLIRPLSRGTRLVSHFRNINAVDHFYWVEDGDLRLHFEPLFAHARDGSDPDGLTDVMRQVGFDLGDDQDRDRELHTEAAFALTEHLTGVRLTPSLLESAGFLCGLTPVPGR
jgi:hypothetical protein